MSIKGILTYQALSKLSLSDFEPREEPMSVLMCHPQFFDIVDVKNVHMEQQQGKVDKALAISQWEKIRHIYTTLMQHGILENVHILPGQPGCEDMVFAANQSLPWISLSGERVVVMSKMRHASRQREVPAFKTFYLQRGYKAIELESTELFEGMGDAIPHPGKRLLYGGYGHRTQKAAWEEISQVLDIPLVTLELINDKFYHLDTCFLPIDADTVLIYSGAFNEAGLSAIEHLFSNVVNVPEQEAEKGFALNAHIISNANGKAAVIQKGNDYTCNVLQEHGIHVYETDTSEYIKSGGSVFCMKMMIY